MKKPLLLLSAALIIAACSGDDEEEEALTVGVNVNANPVTATATARRLEFPRVRSGEASFVVVHVTSEFGVNYSIEWDREKKSQRWSCYEMYDGNSQTNTTRYQGDPQYPDDPDIDDDDRWDTDYFRNSGYDHGHICPSADRLCSAEANYQTFYMSNMQPQINNFNAGIWADMEYQVRQWNKYTFRDTLYVCKGGTIDSDDNIITRIKGRLIVPKYFFMAILCRNSMGYKAIAFWVEHKSYSAYNIADYVVSVDRLEALTGIDFFCNLPDETERQVEAVVYPVSWGL